MADDLAVFSKVLAESLIPFLTHWWSDKRVVPSSGETRRLQGSIRELVRSTSHRDYKWMSEFLSRIASSVRFNKSNFINIHPSPHVPSILAALGTMIQNPNNVVPEVSQATWAMEAECVQWMCEHLVGYDPSRAWGNTVSGGTIGNMTALLVARDYTYHKLSRPRIGDIGSRGVIGKTPGVVLTSASSHYSLQKALWVLGIGYDNLVRVSVARDEIVIGRQRNDERFLKGIRDGEWGDLIRESIREESRGGELQSFYEGNQHPFSLQPLNSEIFKALYACFTFHTPLLACVFSLGTTTTGTIERIDSAAIRRLREEDIHLHMDAAWGGFALVSPSVKRLCPDLDRVDSIVVDGHKMGYMPYPCGCVIFRDQDSRVQIEHDAPYLRHLAPTLEGSRPGIGAAALWAGIHSLGLEGYRNRIERVLAITQELSRQLVDSGRFQVLHSVHLNAVCVAPVPRRHETRASLNSLCDAVRDSMNKDGKFFINAVSDFCGVRVKNKPQEADSSLCELRAIRLVVSSPDVNVDVIMDLVASLCNHLERARRRKT
jgi:glutamate/tyrosine decarboxylase-like PLP-dependent enzyme